MKRLCTFHQAASYLSPLHVGCPPPRRCHSGGHLPDRQRSGANRPVPVPPARDAREPGSRGSQTGGQRRFHFHHPEGLKERLHRKPKGVLHLSDEPVKHAWDATPRTPRLGRRAGLTHSAGRGGAAANRGDEKKTQIARLSLLMLCCES